MQIGDVASRTGLSLRTVRYYEEAGLVEPCERSAGGFRLYSEAECDKFEFVKRLKPLGFSLEDMRALMDLLDALKGAAPDNPARQGLEPFAATVEEHCRLLRAQLRDAQRLADQLRTECSCEEKAGRASVG
ncbi:MAG: MerR family transcriptional regulator [Coriobacteriia bacterium]|nr:MerR family transcriptional regulator [Coriobacteriia bacterium]